MARTIKISDDGQWAEVWDSAGLLMRMEMQDAVQALELAQVRIKALNKPASEASKYLSGDLISAIKQYRADSGLSLRESKDAVEALRTRAAADEH